MGATAKWQKAYRAKKKLNNECTDCKDSAEPNRRRCDYHLRVMRANAERFREDWTKRNSTRKVNKVKKRRHFDRKMYD